ncbi:hypothetical protein BE21_16540 [Sorangium cellulosum]|uniref:Secreted protein n=1 Tax=Sorangium cellulosum TaxID=56 RepID=A0A150TY77_SORCE|nr:hypothetical protein BE21_16540 [Sorangium cellulosum]
MKMNGLRVVTSIACFAVLAALNAVGCAEVDDVAHEEIGQEARNHGISRVVRTTNDLGQTQLDLLDTNGIPMGELRYERSDTLMNLRLSWGGDAYDVTVDGPPGQARTSILVNDVPVVDPQDSTGFDRMPLSIKPALDLAASLVLDAGLEGAPAEEEEIGATPFDGAQDKHPAALECWACVTSTWCWIMTRNPQAKIVGHWDPRPICVEEVWGCGC